MKSHKSICVISGSRADYGHLHPLLSAMDNSQYINLEIILTGMHLSKKFGLTKNQVLKDGFKIFKSVDTLSKTDDPTSICNSISAGINKFATIFRSYKPDAILVLGDRYEIFAAVVAAYFNNIPIIHVHGGETTIGSLDEGIRHSITKFSCIHFTATEEYRRRVIQLGENPETVHDVGAIGLQNLKNISLLPKASLEDSLGMRFMDKNLLVAYHPETNNSAKIESDFRALLEVISSLKNTYVIFTESNADAGGHLINKMITEYVALHTDNSSSFVSLGQTRFLSLLKYVDAIVGNSSSGIIEAPSLKTATINIGNRQVGRVKGESVIDCKPTRRDIKRAFGKIYSDSFRKRLSRIRNPYEKSNSIILIMNILEHMPKKIQKSYTFHDLKFSV